MGSFFEGVRGGVGVFGRGKVEAGGGGGESEC